MNGEHRPNPEFVNRLEWELQSVMRRRASVNGASGAVRLVRYRWGTGIAMALLSMFMGVAGTYAAINRIEGRDAAMHIARAEALLELAQAKLGSVAPEFAKATARAEEGLLADRELRQVEAQVAGAEADVAIRELDLAETLITGEPPNNALSAPQVSGRDFVTERLAERRRPMVLQLELVADRARRYQQLADSGLVTATEHKSARTQIAQAEQDLAALDKLIKLRAAFLAGELSSTQVELEGMLLDTLTAHEDAARQLEALAEQRDRISHLSERGLVSAAELEAIEADLREKEVQLELVDLERRLLDQRLEEEATE